MNAAQTFFLLFFGTILVSIIGCICMFFYGEIISYLNNKKAKKKRSKFRIIK